MATVFRLRRPIRRRQPRLFRDRVGLGDLRDFEVQSRYRLNRESIFELVDLLEEDIVRSTNRSCAIDPLTQVLIGLRYTAKGDFFSELGDIHGVSKSSVCVVLSSFFDSVNRNLDNIRFPQNNELETLKVGFYKSCGIPNVIGAIDGTLIPILAPKEDSDVYICRKGYHSLNIQAVVDHKMRFTDVVAKWPGSQHDSATLDDCGLKEYLEQNDVGVLLGDSGYPLKKYLLTPLSNPTTPQEVRYNECHAKGRIIVEQSFGVLKARFRCLDRTGGCLPFAPGKCSKVATACMRLHNLCIDKKIPLLEPVPPLDGQGEAVVQPLQGSAFQRRETLIRML